MGALWDSYMYRYSGTDYICFPIRKVEWSQAA